MDLSILFLLDDIGKKTKDRVSLFSHWLSNLSNVDSYLMNKRICKLASEGFALPTVAMCLERAKIDRYHFNDFQRWIKEHIPSSDQFEFNGRLVGKYIPRYEYEAFFPTGDFNEDHFSFAHISPDVDTTVTSFFNFINAYASGFTNGIVHWVVPGGIPNSIEIEESFGRVFGSSSKMLVDNNSSACSGTASWSDFSNSRESSNDSLELISCIDHHKSNICTKQPTFIKISRVESTSSLIARDIIGINDKYSSRECSRGESYFLHWERELFEYITLLMGILDDTDLLSKVSRFDLIAVREIINRIVSIKQSKNMEIAIFDDGADKKEMIEDLFNVSELRGLCEFIFKNKEIAVEKAFYRCENSLFLDTKIIGNFAIGQIKHYPSNRKSFEEARPQIRELWITQCNKKYEEKVANAFILMISTIPSFDERSYGEYDDEIWVFSLDGEELKGFIEKFKNNKKDLIKKIEPGTIYVPSGKVASRKIDIVPFV